MSIAQEACNRYVAHHIRMMPQYLGHKGPTRMASALNRVREYAGSELPKLIVDRDRLRDMYDDLS